MGRLGELASKLRRRGEPEKAHRIAERMLALAKHFVDTYPDRPSPHMMVALAYVQHSKDGWRPEHEDLGVVEANLTLACRGAGGVASVPRQRIVQLQIERIQRKLAGLRRRGRKRGIAKSP